MGALSRPDPQRCRQALALGRWRTSPIAQQWAHPLRQSAELAAFRSGLASSRAALAETERLVRFDLVSAYRDLPLRQALIPVWEMALEASTARERDAEAIQRRDLAARIGVLRSQALRARDLQGLAEASAELGRSRQHLSALLSLPPSGRPWPAIRCSTSLLGPSACKTAWSGPLRIDRCSHRCGLSSRPSPALLRPPGR